MGIWNRRTPPGTLPITEPAVDTRQGSGRLTKRTLIVVAAGAAVIALLLAVWQVAQILLLILASILFAVFLRMLAVSLSENTSLSVHWALAAVVLTLFGALVLIALLYGPSIADGFYQLFRQLPAALERIRGTLDHYAWGPSVIDTLSQAGQTLTNPQQISRIAGIFSTAIGALGSFLIVVVLGIYFAVEPKTYVEGTAHLFPQERRDRVREGFGHVEHGLRWWLLGRIAAMSAVGVMTFLGLMILGVPFAFILALVNTLLGFIPNIGPFIAAVPAIMVGLSQDTTTAVYVAVLYLAIQALEGFLLTPYIQQRVVSLPPAILLVAQLLLGAGFGILGLLLAPPLAVVVMVLVQMLYMRDVLGEKVKLP